MFVVDSTEIKQENTVAKGVRLKMENERGKMTINIKSEDKTVTLKLYRLNCKIGRAHV